MLAILAMLSDVVYFIQKFIEDPVSEEIIAERMKGSGRSHGKIRVGLTKEKITVEWVG